MRKFSLLQSLFLFTIILQVSWCLASRGSNGEKLATVPRPQGINDQEKKYITNFVAEEGTINDAGVQVPRFTDFSSFWGMRKVIRCKDTNQINAKEAVNVQRKLRKLVAMKTVHSVHKGGAGGGSGGGGGGGGGGVGGTKGGGGSGAQSNHQTHKKNSAILLAYPWIYILLEIGIYAIAALPFTLI